MAKIAILGYGNLGRGVECAVKQAPDMELVAVFTRRDPLTVKIQTAGVPVLNVSEMEAWTTRTPRFRSTLLPLTLLPRAQTRSP